MRQLVLGAVLTLSQCGALAPALAATEMVLSDSSGDSISLTQAPCALAEQIKAEWLPKFREARVVIGGERSRACWMFEATGHVVVIDEHGRGARFAATDFAPAKPAGKKGIAL